MAWLIVILLCIALFGTMATAIIFTALLLGTFLLAIIEDHQFKKYYYSLNDQEKERIRNDTRRG